MFPVYHGTWMETDNISKSPGHELVPVHSMRDMSLGHIGTFAFCINTSRMSLRLDDDWIYFHVSEIWFSSCSWHAWYVPGTYIDTFIFCIKFLCRSWSLDRDWLYFHVPGKIISSCSWHAWYVPGPWDMSTHLHSVTKPPVCHGDWMETDYISMSPGHELVPVIGMPWYIPWTCRHIYILYQKTLMSWRLDGDWLYFHVPGTRISSCSCHAWYDPGTSRHICILYQYFP